MRPIRFPTFALAGLAAALMLRPFAALGDPPADPSAPATPMVQMDGDTFKKWFTGWQEFEAKVESETPPDVRDGFLGDQVGWRLQPLFDCFFFSYKLTKDTRWVDKQIEWADALVKRAVTEPDGYLGWPTVNPDHCPIDELKQYDADSLFGEATVMRSLVLFSKEILTTPALTAKYGEKAESYITLCEKLCEKWDKRGAWRDTKDGGVIPVCLPYGLNTDRTDWADDFDKRNDPGRGLSMDNNCANAVARWMLAMFDVTGKPVYKQRATKWFTLFKSRLTVNENGTFDPWNIWQPAGEWDYNSDGKPKLTSRPDGPHDFTRDMQAVVEAYEHGIVFSRADIDRFVATGLAQQSYSFALAPFSNETQKGFEKDSEYDHWYGLTYIPEYLLRQTKQFPALIPLMKEAQNPAKDKETATPPVESDPQDPR